MTEPHLAVFVDENSLVEGAREILGKCRPDWKSCDTRFKVFTDGITNKLLGCFNSAHETDIILIRVYGNKTDLLVDRKAETNNIRLLHSVGLAPKLYATFSNGLVYEYVPGEVLTPQTCRLEHVWVLVARKLADMHSVRGEGLTKEPALWAKIRQFMSLVPNEFSDKEKERRYTALFPQKPDLEGEFSFLQQELLDLESPVVFCHNDLLLGNVIYNSDANCVTFIDYEYAAYNYQAYDLANHFNEYAGVEDADYSLFPDENYQKNWLMVYLKRYKSNAEGTREEEVQVSPQEIEATYHCVQKFTLASHFLWGVWCLLQVEYSSIDFDFVNYALVRFREYYNRKKVVFSR